MTKILANENFPLASVIILKQAGYDINLLVMSVQV